MMTFNILTLFLGWLSTRVPSGCFGLPVLPFSGFGTTMQWGASRGLPTTESDDRMKWQIFFGSR